MLFPFALWMPGAFWPADAAAWLPLRGLALIAQIGGQTVIAYAFAHLPASLASISLLIQPLTAAIAALAIFDERIGPWQRIPLFKRPERCHHCAFLDRFGLKVN